jgi:hypothetical protein
MDPHIDCMDLQIDHMNSYIDRMDWHINHMDPHINRMDPYMSKNTYLELHDILTTVFILHTHMRPHLKTLLSTDSVQIRI